MSLELFMLMNNDTSTGTDTSFRITQCNRRVPYEYSFLLSRLPKRTGTNTIRFSTATAPIVLQCVTSTVSSATAFSEQPHPSACSCPNNLKTTTTTTTRRQTLSAFISLRRGRTKNSPWVIIVWIVHLSSQLSFSLHCENPQTSGQRGASAPAVRQS